MTDAGLDPVWRAVAGRRAIRSFTDRPLASGLRATTDLEDAARGALVVVVAVASSGFREVARKLGDFVTGDQILLSVQTWIPAKDTLEDGFAAMNMPGRQRPSSRC